MKTENTNKNEAFEKLTASERLVALLVCEDLSDKEIAARVNRTLAAVRTCLKEIRRKLGARSRVGVALAAVAYSQKGAYAEN